MCHVSHCIVYSFIDDCIEVLVIRGAMMMAQFLEGIKATEAVTWLDTTDSTTKIVKSDNDWLSAICDGILSRKYMMLALFAGLNYWVHTERGQLWRQQANNVISTVFTSVTLSVLQPLYVDVFTRWQQLISAVGF